ncbi:hypothetical protein Ahy_B06g082844 [Arachis hypogaea]|uniref:Aminotransferase-like plant mobile domain-containing protein n=1 Tax=Arachis hypogaea TaxID=3818 RepID=A0A444YP43_ARAHY|nr:hypothetical protein Ahy_B06g082844 [Arachis hypogaea]
MLVWFRALKDRLVLIDDIQIQRYVKCHIMLLFGTVMFGNKSGAGVHWKFLPLLRNFAGIIQFSWGSASLAHMYRALCRATRVDWHNWERENRPYRFRTLEHYRRDLDILQEGQFVWEPYAIGRTNPDVIPPDIRQHSAIWNATVLLISFEYIEWHASDRMRRQFGLTQGVPHQDHILVEHTVPSQHQADIYLHWYRGIYGDHLHLSQIKPQENQHGDPMHNQENQQVQQPPPLSPLQSPPPPSQTQAQQEPE